MKSPSKIHLVLGCALVALFSAIFAAQSEAQVVDDPQIYVCTGCTKPPGIDPNPVDPTNVTMGFAAQSDSSQSPLLVLVAVPNGGGVPTLTLPTGVNFATGTSYYGVTTSGGSAAYNAGTMSSGDVYATLGLSNANNSLSFVNFQTYDKNSLGMNATSYTIYVFAVDYAMTGSTPLQGLSFGNVAAGSFIAGYSCDTVPVSGTVQCANGNPLGATPFTNAGVVVPEPASMLLFGTGLVALGTKLRRKKAAVC